jgi:CBS domain-containing protein
MKPFAEPLPTVMAENLMSRDVIAVPIGMSLRGAAQLLSRARVSGAPVVDARGRCVGVVSTSDFLKLARDDSGCGSGPSCVCSEWQLMELSEIPEDGVEHYMTANPITVRADMALPEIARTMHEAHIHRVFVVDEEHRPLGVISSTDLLAAIAAAEGPRG